MSIQKPVSPPYDSAKCDRLFEMILKLLLQNCHIQEYGRHTLVHDMTLNCNNTQFCDFDNDVSLKNLARL